MASKRFDDRDNNKTNGQSYSLCRISFVVSSIASLMWASKRISGGAFAQSSTAYVSFIFKVFNCLPYFLHTFICVCVCVAFKEPQFCVQFTKAQTTWFEHTSIYTYTPNLNKIWSFGMFSCFHLSCSLVCGTTQYTYIIYVYVPQHTHRTDMHSRKKIRHTSIYY